MTRDKLISAPSSLDTVPSRWVVELLFRELKSQYGLGRFQTEKEHVDRNQVTAALLTLVVSRAILRLFVDHALELGDDWVFPTERWATTFRSYAQRVLSEIVESFDYDPHLPNMWYQEARQPPRDMKCRIGHQADVDVEASQKSSLEVPPWGQLFRVWQGGARPGRTHVTPFRTDSYHLGIPAEILNEIDGLDSRLPGVGVADIVEIDEHHGRIVGKMNRQDVIGITQEYEGCKAAIEATGNYYTIYDTVDEYRQYSSLVDQLRRVIPAIPRGSD